MITSHSSQLKELSLTIPITDSLKILGVMINEKLDWGAHTRYVCKKANQRLHLLRKLKTLVSRHELHEVYISIIRFLLEYSCPIFIGIKDKYAKERQKVDKRAHKIIYRAQNQDSNVCFCPKEVLTYRRRDLSVKLFHHIEKYQYHILHSRIPNRLKFSRRY